ncbi:group 1 glycosyl transferase [Leptolyngbya sp. NIES-3755]|nr:group 1 glycosyl transferase [Leptolyngbya sp. NIES-3755]
MKIGYLHIGEPEHGIVRYGRYLANEARTRPELSVIEAEVVLTGDQTVDRQTLLTAAATLSEADLIHFQHNAHIWGKKHQVQHLKTFLNACVPPKIATLHDVFYPPHHSYLWQQVRHGKRSVIDWLKAIARAQLSPNLRGLRQILDRTPFVLVCTEEEAKRLDRYTSVVKTIPHFVESRSFNITPEAAREQLNLTGKTVITLLGFIYRGKGHDLLVRALAQLPSNYEVVFAGGLGHEDFLQEVIELAKTLGVFDRIRVTGYLSEADQALYLAATHLAVCPFKQTSASGSLCTWISSHKPILAFDLPQIAEYNRLQPNAIATFSAYTPDNLATAIEQSIEQTQDDSVIVQLHRQLEMPVIFDRHLDQYTVVAKG